MPIIFEMLWGMKKSNQVPREQTYIMEGKKESKERKMINTPDEVVVKT